MRDILQCSIAPDYGYKRRSTNREALHAYTQPEGIGYLVRVMFYGRSNFGNFWTKIWLSKQPKATNDTLDRKFSTYSRARRRVLLQTSFSFWEIARCPVNCTHFTTFRLCKITTVNHILKIAPSGLHCPLYSMLVTRSVRIHRCWTLFLVQKIDTRRTNRVSSKFMESSPCACAVERCEWTVSRNLNCYVIKS